MTQDVTDDVKAKELETLREQATLLGLTFHHNAGASKLSELIAEAQAAKEVEKPTPKVDLSHNELMAARRDAALKLIRVVVSPNDPNKRDQDGDFFSAGNSAIGTVTKYVPYNNEAGWHVPQIILNTIRDKRVQRFKKVRTAGGVDIREPTYTPAYTIQVLPPLTPEEIKSLSLAQRARQAVD